MLTTFRTVADTALNYFCSILDTPPNKLGRNPSWRRVFPFAVHARPVVVAIVEKTCLSLSFDTGDGFFGRRMHDLVQILLHPLRVISWLVERSLQALKFPDFVWILRLACTIVVFCRQCDNPAS
jgi:hypothetical protein